MLSSLEWRKIVCCAQPTQCGTIHPSQVHFGVIHFVLVHSGMVHYDMVHFGMAHYDMVHSGEVSGGGVR